jgi:hypothetical protein
MSGRRRKWGFFWNLHGKVLFFKCLTMSTDNPVLRNQHLQLFLWVKWGMGFIVKVTFYPYSYRSHPWSKWLWKMFLQ